jgi:hypothetical protein
MTKTSTRRKTRVMRVTTPQLEETITVILSSAPEPVAGGEIRFQASQLLETDIDSTRVTQVLRQMQSKSQVFSRRETREERIARAGKQSTRGTQGMLWWMSPNIPTRVSSGVIPGIVLGDGNSISRGDKRSRRAYYRKNRERLLKLSRRYNETHGERLAALAELREPTSRKSKSPAATPATPDLISALVSEVSNGRVEKLMARVAELEAQLAEIRKIVRS